jgi:hypothetical protein
MPLYAVLKLEAEPHGEVTWGVDWGRNGDQSCVAILNKLPDGSVELVACEYEPPRSELSDDEIVEIYLNIDEDLPEAEEAIVFGRAILEAAK